MTELEKAARMAVGAWLDPHGMPELCKAMEALRRALEQPAPVPEAHKQEPATVEQIEKIVKDNLMIQVNFAGIKSDIEEAYTRPQAREPLTDEQKDAARWRFLVGNSFDKEGITQFHVFEHSWEPHSQTGESTEWKQRVRGPALDRFIDRAIEAAHGIAPDKSDCHSPDWTERDGEYLK